MLSIHSSIRLFVHSSIHPFVYSSIRPFVYSPIRPFVRSSVRPPEHFLQAREAAGTLRWSWERPGPGGPWDLTARPRELLLPAKALVIGTDAVDHLCLVQVGWSVGRSVGRSIGRSVGQSSQIRQSGSQAGRQSVGQAVDRSVSKLISWSMRSSVIPWLISIECVEYVFVR